MMSRFEMPLGPGGMVVGANEGWRSPRPSVSESVDTLNCRMSHIKGIFRWILDGTQSSRSTISVPEAMRVSASSFWLCTYS